ncbi:MAG: M15 family metallopeptidase [Oscillospiraceae bacterium]|nr:M15 family metallopeptidase [Oscillospiraceae bacterium]
MTERKKIIPAATLALCMALALAACAGPAEESAPELVYHSFEDVGIAMLLPDDLKGRETAEALFDGQSGELSLTVSECGELYPDLDALRAGVEKASGLSAEVVTVNGAELIGFPSAADGRSAEYYTLGPEGDAFRIRLSLGEGAGDKRGRELLSTVTGSLCACGALTESAAAVHRSRARERYSIDYLVLVNKHSQLPKRWEETVDMVTVANSLGDTVRVERSACKAYFALKNALAAEDVHIDLDSAFRSVGEQQEIWDRFTEKYGEDYVKKYVAVPGFSEHHTGLALDLYLNIDGADVYENEDMEAYPELWARIHARLADFGFILRYPEKNAFYTGYGYEPWHIRYVGADAAREIGARGVTLEEYLGADPCSIDYLVLVNKQNALPEYWESTVEIVHMTNRKGEDIGVERTAYEAYCALSAALLEEGVHLDINSAYRTVAQQKALAESYRKKYGEDYVKAYVATPGYSEHHTGLAIDLYLESMDVWAKIHARLAEFGFILRYPDGKESITGYAYEPWHIRYVGVDIAKEITARGITFEEYLGAAKTK